ncbi:uncharacterized protein [Maniola hyperantus]|uniref:uncharacterized protein n=1 Tax=Aphantopus hyperantus TaxID=2795564 RepID=UPI001569AA38|nr:uncharacterized protein LOC117989367 [Maniola hyperantus]
MCVPLSRCCFCMSLDVGSKVISIINLMSSVMIGMVYGTAAMLPAPVAENRKIVYAIIASIAMFQVLIGCLLIYGVFGKKPWLILPWLVTSWVFCLTLLALTVFGSILTALQYAAGEETAAEVSTMASVYCVYGVVLYYFASVINSRRGEMLRDSSTESSQGLMRRDVFKYPT